MIKIIYFECFKYLAIEKTPNKNKKGEEEPRLVKLTE
jgi:hypothetical protein